MFLLFVNMKPPVLFVIVTVLCLTTSAYRIYGGYDPYIDDFPYQALLLEDQKPTSDLPKYFCGAAIISTKIALTAAKCFVDEDKRSPKSGKFLLQAGVTFRIEEGVKIPLDHYVNHPKYNLKNSLTDYNIALVFLKEELPFSKKIQAVKLPKKNPDDKVKANMIGKLAGFGLNKQGETFSMASRLHAMDAPVYSPEECVNFFEDVPKEYTPITERMFCAGLPHGQEIVGCEGDYGGGFVVDGVLYGIASFGPLCQYVMRVPDVFMDVTVMRDFITEYGKL